MRRSKAADDRYDAAKAAAKRKTTIGGQALIEGLMMIGPEKKAMAVRKPDGTIYLEDLPTQKPSKWITLPFVRGCVRLFRQLVTGTKALMRSAEFAEEAVPDETSEPDGVRRIGQARPQQPGRLAAFAERHSQLMLYGSVILGLLFSVALFILLPNFLAGLLARFTGLAGTAGRWRTIALNLVEGAIRIALFIAYLAIASRMRDIRRVWMYHGAEHKTIACYEAEKELTVENVRAYSRFHPRCGTAFLFIVIIVSIIIFSLFRWSSPLLNLLIRFALVPVVGGIAYEIIRLAGRNDNMLTRVMLAPGLWLQRLTTAEPEDDMLEVSIAALNAVLPQQAYSDRW